MKTVRRIMRNHNLALPYGKHKNRTGKRDLTKPAHINMLWETDIHYVSTSRDGMVYLMSIKDCFSKKWVSYEFSRSCLAWDCIRAVEKACVTKFPDGKTVHLVLRTDNGPQYISHEFKESMELLGIRLEYIQKHTPEDNGDIESSHNSLNTDYIWPNEFKNFNDASIDIEKAFYDYNECGLHSSIDYLPTREFRKKFLNDPAFRKRFEKKDVEVKLDEN